MANTKAVFDAATLADAVQKAARVSPTKGAAYDLAAGVRIVIDPAKSQGIVMATNVDVTYHQVVAAQEITGEARDWRIPSAMLSGLVSNLPLGSGATISFIDPGDGAIRVKSGKVAVKINMIVKQEPDTYPAIEPFEPAGLTEAGDFAQKVAQVAWACAKDGSVLSGVHVDGESLIGCNRDLAALVPCKVQIDRAVTVPLFTLGTILRNASDVRVVASDRTLNIQLDPETQATSRLFEAEYPNVKGLLRKDYTMAVTFNRTSFVESAKRMMVVGANDRAPTVKLTFHAGLVRTLTLDLDVPDAGRIQDTIDVTGEYTDPAEIGFTPSYIIAAIENAKDNNVTMELGHADPKKFSLSPVRISDGTGYEVLLMPKRLTD